MIVSCDNCHKKFDIKSSLIPEKGRLLQCNSCNYKWFFKKEVRSETISPIKTPKTVNEPKDFNYVSENFKISENIESVKEIAKDEPIIEKILTKKKNRNNYNILGLTIVFIISFIAIIILMDTFQRPISKIIPNIEFLLYNLYETINDIILFLKDLI
tara:strand:+ start:384 stop:854 length:471 start_codon:yes stop_codon:yes gene_type:complete